MVASGSGPAPASARAAAINEAVRAAVPDGASTLPAWCSSITSTESKKRAACRANCIISTAPTPKFGAMSTCPGVSCQPAPHLVEALLVESAGADHDGDAVVEREPDVVQHRAGMGEVDDHLGAGLDQLGRSSPSSRRATSARSGAASTARHTSPPMRPRAPSTATRMSVTRAL